MNYFDFLVLFILIISSFIGFYRGFIKEVISLFTYIISFLITDLIGDILSPFFDCYTDSILLKDGLSYLIVLFLSLLFCSLIANIVSFFINKTDISNINRIFGAIFGFFRGLFLVLLIVVFFCFTNLSQELYWIDSIFIDTIMILIENIKLYLPYSSKLKELLP
ncbi:MAG: CvpA family protein [Candidatus Kinetoplastibacterium crithidii]|nr:MAG: CvpA family protein [Candidatus Kinetoplastibacterium crithidii]